MGSSNSGNDRSLRLERVLVVGTGLMGTSVGLALREAGIAVALHDSAPGRLILATELGAGVAHTAGQTYDIAVVAVPPRGVAAELLRLQGLNLARTYTDLASVKTHPQLEAQTIGVDLSSYVGGHPIAGRERSGPAAAHADLFVGRPWVITHTAAATPTARSDVRALAVACGGLPVEMDADDHDAALAMVSHLPHLIASLLAAQLLECDDTTVGLGGTGLHDTTRVAAGDALLWAEILAANADHLAAALDRFAHDVDRAREQLEKIAAGDGESARALANLLRDGAQGRARVPLKRGVPAGRFATVPVVVRDEPGELAALLRALGDAGINLEDVRVEHEPGRARGLVEIDVRDDVVPAVLACVRQGGWEIYT